MIPRSLFRRAAPRRRADAGFTILEVSMASFVMALGIATSMMVKAESARRRERVEGIMPPL